MKTRSAFPWLLVLPILSPVLLPVLAAEDAPAAPAPAASAAPAAAAAPAQEEKKTELEQRMDRMGKAFRKLRKQVADPAQNASSLQLLSTMDDAIKEALDLTPEKAEDVPADQRAKFVDDYKAGIKGMQDEFAKLRAALTAGKNDDATKIVAEIFDQEKKDHKEFRRPEKS
jgi:soluble cytochrome b562